MFKISNRNMSMTDSSQEPLSNLGYSDFAKIRVGGKTLDDAVINVGSLKKANNKLADKDTILRALNNNDYAFMREVSNFFYETSGIYSRLCRYLANLYRYDWLVTPYVNSDSIKKEKLLTEFHKVLTYVDNMSVKRNCGDMVLKIVKNGVYYGYIIDNGVRCAFQELPPEYCRSRYMANNRPIVEFNVKFFDDNFRDVSARMNVLKAFPKEFAKAYMAYKSGSLAADPGDQKGWVLLDPTYAFKLSLNNTEMPMMAAVIPTIIDLNEAQDLDKEENATRATNNRNPKNAFR